MQDTKDIPQEKEKEKEKEIKSEENTPPSKELIDEKEEITGKKIFEEGVFINKENELKEAEKEIKEKKEKIEKNEGKTNQKELDYNETYDLVKSTIEKNKELNKKNEEFIEVFKKLSMDEIEPSSTNETNIDVIQLRTNFIYFLNNITEFARPYYDEAMIKMVEKLEEKMEEITHEKILQLNSQKSYSILDGLKKMIKHFRTFAPYGEALTTRMNKLMRLMDTRRVQLLVHIEVHEKMLFEQFEIKIKNMLENSSSDDVKKEDLVNIKNEISLVLEKKHSIRFVTESIIKSLKNYRIELEKVLNKKK